MPRAFASPDASWSRNSTLGTADIPGGIRMTRLDEMLTRRPDRVIRLAVKGMLPKNTLGRRALKRLRVYEGPEHRHEAQRPQILEVGA